jgi:hypothetical protein
MFNPISITISKENYFEYITRSAPKKVDKFFEKMDDEDCVNGYLIKLPSYFPACYDELWLFDLEDQTAPVLIKGINGSSEHALWCCNFEDYCEEEGEENSLDLENLIRMVGNGWKNGLQKVMEAEYINKKEDSVDDIFNFLKNSK